VSDASDAPGTDRALLAAMLTLATACGDGASVDSRGTDADVTTSTLQTTSTTTTGSTDADTTVAQPARTSTTNPPPASTRSPASAGVFGTVTAGPTCPVAQAENPLRSPTRRHRHRGPQSHRHHLRHHPDRQCRRLRSAAGTRHLHARRHQRLDAPATVHARHRHGHPREGRPGQHRLRHRHPLNIPPASSSTRRSGTARKIGVGRCPTGGRSTRRPRRCSCAAGSSTARPTCSRRCRTRSRGTSRSVSASTTPRSRGRSVRAAGNSCSSTSRRGTSPTRPRGCTERIHVTYTSSPQNGTLERVGDRAHPSGIDCFCSPTRGVNAYGE
jgi:hypothetical protein